MNQWAVASCQGRLFFRPLVTSHCHLHVLANGGVRATVRKGVYRRGFGCGILIPQMKTGVPRFLFDNLKKAVLCAVLYAAVLAGGIFLLLVATSVIGYLPYSDRPGPGWFVAHLPTMRESGFFASWSLFFVGPFALLWGPGLWLFIRLVGWLDAPRLLLRVLGGLLAGFLSLFGIAAAGWYIAISAVAVYGGGVLGLLFGALVLPKFASPPDEPVRRGWWRVVAIAGITLLFGAVIVYPLLPDRNAQSLEVLVVSLTPGPEQLTTDNTGLSEGELKTLNSLNLRGTLQGEIQSYSGGGDKHARALIVVRGPMTSKVVRQPKATNVIYVQDGTTWRMYPNDAPTLRKKITLGDARGGNGMTVAVDP